jgi:hypothetical protein
VDDLDKSASFDVGEAPRRSTSSLGIPMPFRCVLSVSVLLGIVACVPGYHMVSKDITGLVVDAITGVPIANAHIYLKDVPKAMTRSVSNGSFHIASVREWTAPPLGSDVRPSYRLVVEAQGYHSEYRRYDVGDDRPYVVKLVPAAN